MYWILWKTLTKKQLKHRATLKLKLFFYRVRIKHWVLKKRWTVQKDRKLMRVTKSTRSLTDLVVIVFGDMNLGKYYAQGAISFCIDYFEKYGGDYLWDCGVDFTGNTMVLPWVPSKYIMMVFTVVMNKGIKAMMTRQNIMVVLMLVSTVLKNLMLSQY